MTVYANKLNKREVNRFGASDFIGKPFDAAYLKNRIENLIDVTSLCSIFRGSFVILQINNK